MKNYLHRFGIRFLLLLVGSGLVGNAEVQATSGWKDKATAAPQMTDPPFFTDPVPADTTISCIYDMPPPVSLMANDDAGPAFPQSVGSVDSPDPLSLNTCQVGFITRSWTTTADSDGQITTVTQIITVLPDGDPPIFTDLAPRHDTVSCEMSKLSAPSTPLRYDVWLNSLRLVVATSTFDGCSALDALDDDAPVSYEENCGTLTVTFTAIDQCGNEATYVATYTTIDTVAPQLSGLPVTDTLVIDCSTPVPNPPAVTASDDCTPGLIPTYSESTLQTAGGACAAYEYTLSRTWTVSDSCGNSTSFTQIIIVEDENAPTFTVPGDIVIDCSENAADTSVTGTITMLADNCTPVESIVVSYSDTDTVFNQDCPFSFAFTRTWRASDLCGNVAVSQQDIEVVDQTAPVFSIPADTTVSCEDANNLTITGEPTAVGDNCDPNPLVSFSDVVLAGNCPNNYTIRRTWEVVDVCGNITASDQLITVSDFSAPTFEEEADDLILFCEDEADLQQAFDNWIAAHANAAAIDQCSDTESLEWFAFNAGTNEAPSLPAISCPADNGVLISRMIDFIVLDECGNQDTTQALFQLRDEVPPVVRACPEDVTIATDAGSCEGTFTLLPPVIEEACTFTSSPVSLSASTAISSQAAPGDEGTTPVDPITFNLAVTQPLPINAAGPADLTITLENSEANEPTEFFNIYGENGALIGITALTSAVCGTSTVTFSIAPVLLNEWAADGVIIIRLEPNIPAGMGGEFAINNICNPIGTVKADLIFENNDQLGIVLEYRVDNGPRVAIMPIEPTNILLGQGTHQIFYFATDCGGNSDSCSFSVTVVDEEAPVLSCPADMIVSLVEGECTANVTLPLPANAADNCEVFGGYSATLPVDTSAAYLTFQYDPNLSEYRANQKTFTFTGVAANALGDVAITFDLLGDFSTNNAFVNIQGEDGTVIGSGTVGVADCVTPGQFTTTISAATFNAWAADGSVQFRAVPNPVNVPPGVPGDGINPCDPSVVSQNGASDGISYIFATLTYQTLAPVYYAVGATNVPLSSVQFPAVTPTHTFQRGVTEVFYIVEDVAGNPDTCSFLVTVEDNIPPVALCQNIGILSINPSGQQVEVVDVSTVDLGSYDNCGIASMTLSPNTFTCADAGLPVNVTLTVVDSSGNAATCALTAGISITPPMPTANSGLCGGDTLFLFANPPPPGLNGYSYRWFREGTINPISNLPNPVFPNINPGFEGFYTVRITGAFGGCTAEGSVFVDIEDLPLTPTLSVTPTICNVDDIILESTSNIPSGSNVTFYWYQGNPMEGILIDSTATPELVLPGPHPIGTMKYYLEVKANGCLSPPSLAKMVTVVQKPVAAVMFTDTVVCAGESVILGSNVTGNGFQYNWTGPNGFHSTAQFPATGALAVQGQGYYYLTIISNGCASERDSTLITVKPKPATPSIINNGPLCAGANLVLTTPVTGVSSYSWEYGTDGNNIFTTSNPSFVVNNAGTESAGLWRVRVMKNGCTSNPSPTTDVVINPTPTASAFATPNPVCIGSSLTLQGSADIPASFTWTGPNIQPQMTAVVPLNNASPANQGAYMLEVRTNPGCVDTASVFVTVLDGISQVDISDNAPACLTAPTDVSLSPFVFPPDDGTYSFHWSGPGFASNQRNAVIQNATAAQSGNYMLTVTNGSGCSFTRTYSLDLQDAPVPPAMPATVSGPATYCVGDQIRLMTSNFNNQGSNVTYIWQKTPGPTIVTTPTNELLIEEASMSDAGNYTVSVLVDGCASPFSPFLNVVVNPIPNITASSNSPVCRGDIIEFSAQSSSNATFKWFGPNNFNSSLQFPQHNSNNQQVGIGTYRVVSTVAGCQSDTAVVLVQVKPRPAIPIVDNSGQLCLDDPTAALTLYIDSISATNGATYTWYANNQFNPISTASTELEFLLTDFTNFSAGGTYSFYAQADLNGCTSAISQPTTTTLNIIPSNAAEAGMDTTSCLGQINLNAAPPSSGSGRWTLIGGDPLGVTIANPDVFNTIVSGLTINGGPYTFRWALSAGACVNYSVDSVMISVAQGEQSIAGDDILVCEEDVVNLAASPPTGAGSVGTWTQPPAQETLGIVIEDPFDPNTVINNLEADNLYTFNWVITTECGTSTDYVFVTVSDPDPDAGPDVIACNDDRFGNLQAAEPTIGSDGSWSAVDPELLIDNQNNPGTIVRNLKPGENYFVWTIDEGICGPASQDTVVVFYKENLVANDDNFQVGFQEEQTLDILGNDRLQPETQISILSDPVAGVIRVENGQFIYTPPSNFVGSDRFTYELSTDGCHNVTATVNISVGDGVGCIAPSIITPNNDGVNDAFVVPCLLDTDRLPNSQVIIFNRWGDEVFRSGRPYLNDWSGKFDGEDVPVGTYFYVVEFGNGAESMSGFVMIQR